MFLVTDRASRANLLNGTVYNIDNKTLSHEITEFPINVYKNINCLKSYGISVF